MIVPAALLFAAVERPNFAGTWVLDPAKSDMGGMPVPTKMIRVVTQEGAMISVTTNIESERGPTSTDAKYIVDGKTETLNKSRFGDLKSLASWKDDALELDSKIEVQGNAISSREVWTLSPDAKTLTVKGTIAAPQQTFATKLVLNKQ